MLTLAGACKKEQM